MVFYTDVFGISPAAAGVLLLVTRLSDGVTDVIMGMIADRTNTKQGKFRPWILWTSFPLGIVMTPDHQERTSLSAFRFAGAYFGGIITQGFLIYLVIFLGNGNENIGYQYSIYLLSAVLIAFLLITYFSTKERVKPTQSKKMVLRLSILSVISMPKHLQHRIW